jgi:hypothetical protein
LIGINKLLGDKQEAMANDFIVQTVDFLFLQCNLTSVKDQYGVFYYHQNAWRLSRSDWIIHLCTTQAHCGDFLRDVIVRRRRLLLTIGRVSESKNGSRLNHSIKFRFLRAVFTCRVRGDLLADVMTVSI